MKLFSFKSYSLVIFCNPWCVFTVATFADSSRKTFAPTWSDRTYGYSFVERSQLEYGNVVSMIPKGWLASASKVARPDHNKPRITDIIYMPSFFSVNESSSFDAVLEDDHFTSLLCDEGFTVHSINPHKAKDSKSLFRDIIFQLTNKWQPKVQQGLSGSTPIGNAITGRNLALVGCELSCIHLLNYLSETALPMSVRRVDIGAVVLIDPPPLSSLLSSHGRLRILSRYITPLLSSSRPDKEDRKVQGKVMSKKQKQRLLRAQQKAVAKEGGLVPYEIPPTDQDPVAIYRSILQRKGEEGKYLLGLAETQQSRVSSIAASSTSSNNLVKDTSASSATTFDFDNSESNFLTEEDEIAFQQLFPSYQLSQLDDDYDELPEMQYSTFATGEEQAQQRLEVDMLGRYPKDITSVANALKNRILVIATPQLKSSISSRNDDDDSTLLSSSSSSKPMILLQADDIDSYLVGGGGRGVEKEGVEDDEVDHWGHAAVEEVSLLLQAGPVLYTQLEDDEENDEQLEEERNLSTSTEVISDKKEQLNDNDNMDYAAKEQRNLATTIADWLNMLPAFGYL